MSLHSIIGGIDQFAARQRAKADTEIVQILATWSAPPWDMAELFSRHRDIRTCSIVRSIRYWPDGRIRDVEYEPSYDHMIQGAGKPWVLIGTYRGEGLFAWEHRYL